MGKWIVSPGKWFVDEEVNKGLQVTEDMRFHSISARAFALFALCGVAAEVYFEETFSGDWEKTWKTGSPAGKWIVSPGKWFVDEEVNKGLQVTEDMRFHSISAKLDKKASSKKKDLVLQFSAKIENHQ